MYVRALQMAWYAEFTALADPAPCLEYKGKSYLITRQGVPLSRPLVELSALGSIRYENWYRADVDGKEQSFLRNPNGTFELANPSHYTGAPKVIQPDISLSHVVYNPNEAKRAAGKLAYRRIEVGFVPSTMRLHEDAKQSVSKGQKITAELSSLRHTLGNLLHHIAQDESLRKMVGEGPAWALSRSALARTDPLEILGALKVYLPMLLDGGNWSLLKAVEPVHKDDPLAAYFINRLRSIRAPNIPPAHLPL